MRNKRRRHARWAEGVAAAGAREAERTAVRARHAELTALVRSGVATAADVEELDSLWQAISRWSP